MRQGCRQRGEARLKKLQIAVGSLPHVQASLLYLAFTRLSASEDLAITSALRQSESGTAVGEIARTLDMSGENRNPYCHMAATFGPGRVLVKRLAKMATNEML
jgi:hypothetical protein